MPKKENGFHLTQTLKTITLRLLLTCQKKIFEALYRYYMVIHKISEKYKVKFSQSFKKVLLLM